MMLGVAGERRVSQGRHGHRSEHTGGSGSLTTLFPLCSPALSATITGRHYTAGELLPAFSAPEVHSQAHCLTFISRHGRTQMRRRPWELRGRVGEQWLCRFFRWSADHIFPVSNE